MKLNEELTVSQYMEKDVCVAHPDTRADVIASMMIEGFGAVPIVDETRRLLGIVSEHDLLVAYARGQEWGTLKAREIMTFYPYSIRPETTIGTLIHVLVASNLIRVPVVDQQGKIVGIVARRDVVKGCLSQPVRPRLG